MCKKFFLSFVATVVVFVAFVSCIQVDPISDENTFFVKNNTCDTIVVEYTFDSAFEVSDESRVVAPTEIVELSSEGLTRRSYQCIPSYTYTRIIAIANNDTIMNQNPIDDSLWVHDKDSRAVTDKRGKVDYYVTLNTWTLVIE